MSRQLRRVQVQNRNFASAFRPALNTRELAEAAPGSGPATAGIFAVGRAGWSAWGLQQCFAHDLSKRLSGEAHISTAIDIVNERTYMLSETNSECDDLPDERRSGSVRLILSAITGKHAGRLGERSSRQSGEEEGMIVTGRIQCEQRARKERWE